MKTDTRVFEVYDNIEMQAVRFKNRFGIELAGHLYLPKDYQHHQSGAIILAGPFGAVKEQTAGMYAQEMATWGFVALAFDPSYTGESSGTPRNVASPEIFTEDFSAGVDYLGLLKYVDRNRIGAFAICSMSGMALNAAGTDSRIKAVAAASMSDLSKKTQVASALDRKSQRPNGMDEARWEDAAFDDYYKTTRGYHPNSINSTGAWTAIMPTSFFSLALKTNVQRISPRPLMLIAGEHAQARDYSESIYYAAHEPKELVIVPDANHVDLYDQKDKIPFDRLKQFFMQALMKATVDVVSKSVAAQTKSAMNDDRAQ